MSGVDFDVLAFFKEEIKSEGANIKIGAVNKLHLIANALGPSKTVSELVPYLNQVIKEEPWCDDEEFLYCVAKQFATLAEYINGQYVLLTPALGHLAAQEETAIRDQAISSLRVIVEKKPSLVPENVVPILDHLMSKSDFFTSRVSACALVPTAYPHATDDQKAELRKGYEKLCSDDTPMVRRAAAHNLCAFVAVCDRADLLKDMVQVYRQLSQEDTQDTIRVTCVHTTLVLARMFSPEDNRAHTVQVIQEASEDRSWRVRLTVAKNFDQLCSAFGAELTSQCLMDSFKLLIKDNEQEVRKEAIRVIEPMLKLQNSHPSMVEQLHRDILPLFSSLATDSAQPVRAALAQVLGPMAKALGRDVTQKQLLPQIADLMKDEFSDVRLNIVSQVGLICEVLSADGLISSLLHTIQGLATDNHWRIRQSVAEQVPKLAKLFGVDMFQTKLEPLFLASLRDCVHSVRQAAIVNLKDIAETFGPQWTVEHWLPKIIDHYSQSAGYANRVTTLHGLPQVSHLMSPDQVVMHIVPILIKATKDTVPNVRFCACQTIEWMVENHNLGQASVDTIRRTLTELEQDSDIDVLYFASRALAKCNSNH